MNFLETKIQGCYLIELSPFVDSRGSYTKIFSKEVRDFLHFTPREYAVVNFEDDTWRSGKINLHPYTAAKIFFPVSGCVTWRIGDLRKDSKSFRQIETFQLSDTCGKALYMPKGCVNWERREGSAEEKKTIVMYSQSADYNAETEITVNFDDLEIFNGEFMVDNE